MCLAPDGNYYGLNEDGVFRMDGGSDDGDPIPSLFDLGKQNLGDKHLKCSLEVHADMAEVEEGMRLRVGVSDGDFVFACKGRGSALQQYRLIPAAGLRSSWFRIALLNVNGGDFMLESLEATARASKTRRT